LGRSKIISTKTEGQSVSTVMHMNTWQKIARNQRKNKALESVINVKRCQKLQIRLEDKELKCLGRPRHKE